MERRTKGRELQVEGCGTESIETTFADGNEVRIVAVLLHSRKKCGDAAFGEMTGMEFDAVILLFGEVLLAIGLYYNTHPLGWYREDGSWPAVSVGVDVGKGKQVIAVLSFGLY